MVTLKRWRSSCREREEPIRVPPGQANGRMERRRVLLKFGGYDAYDDIAIQG